LPKLFQLGGGGVEGEEKEKEEGRKWTLITIRQTIKRNGNRI
jgi:hypothetical protein